MYRLSPTMLDSYRLYKTTNWKSYTDIVLTIKREVVETEPMKVGRAVHHIKEGLGTEKYGMVLIDGYIFRGIEKEDKKYISELKITPKIQTPYGNCIISMVADAIYGNEIKEYKTTQSPIDIGRYMEYYQWRCYLWGFCAEKIIYEVMEINQCKDGIWKVKNTEKISLCPYIGMEEDIRLLVEDMIAFCHSQGLQNYILE